MFTSKTTRRILVNLSILLILISGYIFSPTNVQALGATFTVTTDLDDISTNSLCSLREAISNANTDSNTYTDCLEAGSGGDTIVFADGITTITLSATLPTITDFNGLTINGGGDVIIDGSDTYRILLVDTGAALTLENLTVEDGACTSCSGGGVYSSGGTLTIANSTFNSNQEGISVYDGTITITNSVFTGNDSVYGGAVNSSGANGSLAVTNSTFSGNSATGGGSAIYAGGQVSINNSSFIDNTGSGGSTSTVFVDGTTDASIKNSTFSGSVGATTRAIYNNSATLEISNSTFYGNVAPDYGGGVLNTGGTLTVKNSTFSGNGGPSGGGDIYQYGPAASLNLFNTILANDDGGGNCLLDGGTASGNNNLIEDTINTCGFSNASGNNIIGSDPILGAPTGSPAYFPLSKLSPANNAGDDTVCSAAPVNNTSQNGIPRPQGTHCEIGSTESTVTLMVRSNGPNDGWILEATETSSVGGSMNSTATGFNLGDATVDRQYRVILHFNTAGLPDTAVITKAILRIRKQTTIGTDPFTVLGRLKADMRKPSFGAVGLAINDFQASAGRVGVATFGLTPINSWYSAQLTIAGRAYLNKTGPTQFRLYFTRDDNDNGIADYTKFISGNHATVSARPTLIIEYYVP